MDLGNSISLLFCIPFLGMLLSICGFSTGKTSLVGKKSEICSYSLVTVVFDSVCYSLWLWRNE